ncbi:hypothetical protein [Streptomyces sp. NPDC020965]|uniref:hypothetical protein n=1 Tax=Streptomyces sp. NPDC020965 TaxID=3365105 RepID=UPI0037B4F62E
MAVWKDRRARAEASAEALRAALAGRGVPERVWRSIRPVVTASGSAFVDLGVFRPDVIDQITAALILPES